MSTLEFFSVDMRHLPVLVHLARAFFGPAAGRWVADRLSPQHDGPDSELQLTAGQGRREYARLRHLCSAIVADLLRDPVRGPALRRLQVAISKRLAAWEDSPEEQVVSLVKSVHIANAASNEMLNSPDLVSEHVIGQLLSGRVGSAVKNELDAFGLTTELFALLWEVTLEEELPAHEVDAIIGGIGLSSDLVTMVFQMATLSIERPDEFDVRLRRALQAWLRLRLPTILGKGSAGPHSKHRGDLSLDRAFPSGKNLGDLLPGKEATESRVIMRADLLKMVSELLPVRRLAVQIFAESEVSGIAMKEVAVAHGVSPDAAAQNLKRARGDLRKMSA
ncbi:MAG: hypothetical protein JW395_1922 [Nitrospira sp.]|nr:hypothetical protein [Nitrospira sp.]